MIRYRLSVARLAADIDAVAPDWRTAADIRRAAMLAAGAFDDGNTWSRIKPVYMRLQHYKCIYCETMLQQGTIAHDLEHFRPKNDVKPWSEYEHGTRTGGIAETGMPGGYFWLAYDIGNYAAACKICNSNCKSTYFPIDAGRGRVGAMVGELAEEKPLLCYPIGETDSDPETLMTFVATIVIPNRAASTFDQRRGQAMIQLFALNEREDLQRDRKRMLLLLAPYLERKTAGSASPLDLAVVDACLSGKQAHTACCRAFERLWSSDPEQARNIWEACKASMIDGLQH